MTQQKRSYPNLADQKTQAAVKTAYDRLYQLQNQIQTVSKSSAAVASSAVWGKITGSLTSQTDLATALASMRAQIAGSSVTLPITESDVSGLVADLATIPAASSTTPLMDSGAGVIGTGATYARADHVHPSDTSRVPTATTVNGHALSGNVTVSASDLTTGTLPHAQLPALVAGDIPNIAESQVTSLVSDLAAKAPLPLSGTSGSLGGSLLTAGQTITTTVTVTGATTAMVAVCSPVTYPGAGTAWDAYVSSANTVTVRLTAILALTPSASVYNVRVLQ